MANFIIDIRNSLQSNLLNNPNVQGQLKGINEKLGDITKGLPNIVGNITGSFNYLALRKKISKRLKREKRKYGLALEFLGWGTLAKFLDSAFMGDLLDVHV